MTSPRQRIAQHIKHARRCAALARACAVNGNPISAGAFRISAKGSIAIARTIRATF